MIISWVESVAHKCGWSAFFYQFQIFHCIQNIFLVHYHATRWIEYCTVITTDCTKAGENDRNVKMGKKKEFVFSFFLFSFIERFYRIITYYDGRGLIEAYATFLFSLYSRDALFDNNKDKNQGNVYEKKRKDSVGLCCLILIFVRK